MPSGASGHAANAAEVIPLRRAGTPGSAKHAEPRRAPAVPFAALPADDRSLLLSLCTLRRFARGSAVFSQGTRHTASFIVERGLVRTYYTSSTGKEVTMAYWSYGDLLGGPNFLTTDTLHVWSARAVEDASVWCIRAEDLEALVKRRPAIARFIIDSMTLKLFWVSALLQAFGTQSVFLRLAHLLLKLAELYGTPSRNGIMICNHFTQEDLANMVGASRQWVSVALMHLQRDDIIRCGKRRLEIQNIDLLQRLVGEGRHASPPPEPPDGSGDVSTN